MKSFNVIVEDVNRRKMEFYDVMPYLVGCYEETKENSKSDYDKRPKTFEEFKEFVERKSRYMYWARCEYEIVLSPWVGNDFQEKWDVHKQIMGNINIVTQILMENVKSKV